MIQFGTCSVLEASGAHGQTEQEEVGNVGLKAESPGNWLRRLSQQRGVRRKGAAERNHRDGLRKEAEVSWQDAAEERERCEPASGLRVELQAGCR